MEDLHNQIWHLRREVADLKTQNWKLQQERAWWQEWWNDVGWQREQEIETMRSGHFFSPLRISSPLTIFLSMHRNQTVTATTLSSMSLAAHAVGGR